MLLSATITQTDTLAATLLLVVAFGMVIVTYSCSLWFNGLPSYSGL